MDVFNEIVNWLQIASIALFFIFFLGKTFYLRRKEKLNAIVIKPGKPGSRNPFSLLSVLIVNIWIGFILFYLLNNTFRKWLSGFYITAMDSRWLKILGIMILVLTFIILILAQATLGNSWRLGIDRRHPGKLVTGRIYSISRHPVYLFFDLYFFSVFLLNANLFFLFFTVIIAVILHLQIIAEEKFLNETYRQKYKEYSGRVGMYLTFSRGHSLSAIDQEKIPD